MLTLGLCLRFGDGMLMCIPEKGLFCTLRNPVRVEMQLWVPDSGFLQRRQQSSSWAPSQSHTFVSAALH